MLRARVVIEGRVQGVGFRYQTCMQAERLAVRGWVRNLPDGRVEAEFEGPDRNVEEILAWCREGPATARVSHVNVTLRESQDTARHTGFSMRA